MWTLTRRLYKEGTKEQYGLGEVNLVKEFNYISPSSAIDLFETVGYEKDELFTYPEWGRYVLTKYEKGKGLIEITIEEVE